MLFRCLTLIALVLMPLGMAGNAAMAAPAPLAASMDHCDREASHKAPGDAMDCSLTCSAILPDLAVFPEMPPPVASHRRIDPADFVRLIEPEIVTPPPKRS